MCTGKNLNQGEMTEWWEWADLDGDSGNEEGTFDLSSEGGGADHGGGEDWGGLGTGLLAHSQGQPGLPNRPCRTHGETASTCPPHKSP